MPIYSSPTPVDLRPCIQGEDYSQTLEFLDENNTAIDFSGSSFAAKIRRGSGESLIGTFTVTNPSTGQIKLALSSATTAAIPFNTYQYDLFQIDGSGNKIALTYGRFPVIGGITEV